MPTIEEIQERRRARKAELNTQRLAQYAVDLEQLDELELEHGDGNLVIHHISDDEGVPTRYIPGCTTIAIFRLPKRMEMKRYQDMCRKEKSDKVAAANMVATACRLYPDKDGYNHLLEVYPGIHTTAAIGVLNAASGVADEEGKS